MVTKSVKSKYAICHEYISSDQIYFQSFLLDVCKARHHETNSAINKCEGILIHTQIERVPFNIFLWLLLQFVMISHYWMFELFLLTIKLHSHNTDVIHTHRSVDVVFLLCYVGSFLCGKFYHFSVCFQSIFFLCIFFFVFVSFPLSGTQF